MSNFWGVSTPGCKQSLQFEFENFDICFLKRQTPWQGHIIVDRDNVGLGFGDCALFGFTDILKDVRLSNFKYKMTINNDNFTPKTCTLDI